MDDFCENNRAFEWGLVISHDRKAKSRDAVEKYFRDTMPENMRYYVTSVKHGSMTIDIGNGVTVNMKKGTFALLGLYTSLDDVFKAFMIPSVLVLIKKYWMINLCLFYVMILILIVLSGNIFDNIGWIVLWVLGLVGLLFLFVRIYENANDWSDIFQDTKIEYLKFNKRMGIPYLSMLTSAQAIISFLAAIATIISTIYLIGR